MNLNLYVKSRKHYVEILYEIQLEYITRNYRPKLLYFHTVRWHSRGSRCYVQQELTSVFSDETDEGLRSICDRRQLATESKFFKRRHQSPPLEVASRCQLTTATYESRRPPRVRTTDKPNCIDQIRGPKGTGHLADEIPLWPAPHGIAWKPSSPTHLGMPMREQGESLLPLSAVKARVGMGQTKIYEAMRAGAFPKCIKNGRTSVWIESEVDGWVRETIRRNKNNN